MQFSSSLYSYQKEILSIFEKERAQWEKKIHIVAPPGSGKTVVGLEMICRLDVPTVILVPNLTLQEQWRDKIERLFLEESESITELVSTSITDIKKINIITYQSLAGTDDENEDIQKKILDIWFESEKDEFNSHETFLLFVNELKEENPKEYQELYTKHRKKLKESGNSEYTRKLMKWTIHDYILKLKESGVKAMVVDEAHHLTSWWSHVLYEIWTELSEPYIIGLTATPPFENADFFELDESYVKLLWTVDYYVPTPAIVKSGRLAPYSDLVYIVSPDATLDSLLQEKEKNLENFLATHRQDIVHYLHGFLSENFEQLKIKSLDALEKWMRFVYTYKDANIDMSAYITKNAAKEVSLEDIAKSIGKWAADDFKKTKKTIILDEVKALFFDLGYIWRGMNLYRFETPIEKWLIYSKSKIEWTYTLIEKEEQNLGKSLRLAIITDFLDVESDWINAHYIFDEVAKKYKHLNPYLVSGQGIWKMQNGQKILAEDESILSVTEKLTKWETQVVIGTRWILGEWWDCPAVNTLIDLTGVSAYMSVNQVHGRAIRMDLTNPEKVANIYDIVCIGKGFQGRRDFDRLERKHAQFYGVDDSGLIIKELDHIYPQLEKYIDQKEKINNYTLKKSSLRGMVKELWNIGSDFQNEEVFSLSIEIQKPFSEIYIPNTVNLKELRKVFEEKEGNTNLLELGKSTYHTLMRRWIDDLIRATLQVMKPFWIIPEDFTYTMKWSDTGSIKITGNHEDQLLNKKFLEIITPIFSPITDEKYVLKNDTENWKNERNIREILRPFISWFRLVFYFLLFSLIGSMLMALFPSGITFFIYLWLILSIITANRKKNKANIELLKRNIQAANINNIEIGIPDIIASNEEKRRYFLGEKYPSISEEAKWYSWVKDRDFFFNKSKSTIIGFVCIMSGFIYLVFDISSIIPSIISGALLGVLASYLGIFMIFIIGSIIHYPYVIYAQWYNERQRKKVIQLSWDITPTTQEDIGKKTLLTGKIEKLWI